MFIPIKDYNPTRKPAVITIIIILLNVGIFLYQGIMTDLKVHVAQHALIPWEVSHFRSIEGPLGYAVQEYRGYQTPVPIKRESSPIVSLFFSIFMHGSIMHLLGNMLFLWIFGNNIEDTLGALRFIFFYLFCGVSASLVHVFFNMDSLIPVIGASGAVSGVMGAYLILYPHARVRTLVFFFIITFIDVPAFVFLIIWFIMQILFASSSSGIAWLAHVGGFLVGIMLIKIMKKKPIIEVIQ